MNHNFARIFDFGLRFLLAYLPWSTFISVFVIYKLHIPGVNFLKEFVLFLMIVSLAGLFYGEVKNKTVSFKKFFQKNLLTTLIFLYIITLSIVTLFTTGIRGLVFGGRYDFVFLVVFLVAFYGYQFLEKPLAYYLKIFLYSAASLLFVSGLLKFPLSEEILLYFGYSASASMWDFGGAPPIFHGIDGAGVRRFQGLLDGPNTMGAFLIIFTGVLLYYFRFWKEWYFAIGIVVFGVILMILYTYSRSAMLGFIAFGIIAFLGNFKFLFKKYKKQLYAIGGLMIFFIWAISLKYSGTSDSIIGREGSTRGHAERMQVGIERTLEKPIGHGLGSAGPAYRYVLQLQDTDRTVVEEQDRFYIPESWYIQQFIEWGIIGGMLFLIIMAVIFFSLFSVHSLLAGVFAGIGVMNLVLHTFESSVISWLLFLLIGLFLSYEKQKRTSK